MTFEELKAEAEKQGYVLTKKIKYEKLKKCACGNSRSVYEEISISPRGKYFVCKNCKLKGEIARTLYKAIENWNFAVDSAKGIDGWKGE